MLDLFTNKYPYSDYHELNLDWLVSKVIAMNVKLDNFVSLNTIKYADPIAWDITKQYETNTVVIDSNTGIAYISNKPVPYGVSISDTDYWSVIFDLQQIIGLITANLTFHNNGTSPTLLASVVTGDWILWNNKLYVAKADLIAGTALIVGVNVDEASVEDLTKTYTDTAKNALYLYIGLLSDLNTTDKTSIVNAINEVFSDLTTLVAVVGSLSDLNTSDKTSIVNAINSLLSDVTTKIGNLTSLTTTDKTSIVNAINELVTTIGPLSSLITSDKSSVVNAVNSVLNDMLGVTGIRANLNTTDKSNLVNAINEVNTDLGTERSTRINADNALDARIDRLEDYPHALDGKNILILGDSLSAPSGGVNRTWTRPFTDFITAHGGYVDNRSAGGARISNMWAIAQTLVDTYDIAIIFVGVNDSNIDITVGDITQAGSFGAVYKETIDYIRVHSPNALIYCVSVGYFGTKEFKTRYNPAFYSACIKSVCDYQGCNFIDISQMPNASLYCHTAQYSDLVHYTEEYSTTVLYNYILNKILSGTNDPFNKHFDYFASLSSANSHITINTQRCTIDVTGNMTIRVSFTIDATLTANTVMFNFNGDLRPNIHSFIKNGGFASVVTTVNNQIVIETAIIAGTYEIDMEFTSPYITAMALAV